MFRRTLHCNLSMLFSPGQSEHDLRMAFTTSAASAEKNPTQEYIAQMMPLFHTVRAVNLTIRQSTPTSGMRTAKTVTWVVRPMASTLDVGGVVLESTPQSNVLHPHVPLKMSLSHHTTGTPCVRWVCLDAMQMVSMCSAVFATTSPSTQSTARLLHGLRIQMVSAGFPQGQHKPTSGIGTACGACLASWLKMQRDERG